MALGKGNRQSRPAMATSNDKVVGHVDLLFFPLALDVRTGFAPASSADCNELASWQRWAGTQSVDQIGSWMPHILLGDYLLSVGQLHARAPSMR